MPMNFIIVLFPPNPWKHAPRLFSGPDDAGSSGPKSMEGTSENITPAWAISPHTPAATRYSSSRTRRQWLTWMILVKYAQRMISQCNVRSVHVSVWQYLSIIQSRANRKTIWMKISLLKLFAFSCFLCSKWKGCRSYWFCSSIHPLSKMH